MRELGWWVHHRPKRFMLILNFVFKALTPYTGTTEHCSKSHARSKKEEAKYCYVYFLFFYYLKKKKQIHQILKFYFF